MKQDPQQLDLLEKIKQSHREQPLSAGWTWATIQELAGPERGSLTDGPFGSNLKTSHYTESGPRVIRLQNIGDGIFGNARAHIAPEHFDRLRKHEARSGDVVVAMLGEVLPRAAIVPEWLGQAIVKADCVRFRVSPGNVEPRWMVHVLNAPQTRAATKDLIHGVGRPRLGLKLFRQLEVPFPPYREQTAVADLVDDYLSRIDAAVAGLERVQANLKRYRASVLKAAVEGRLVPTEAELARQEGRDYEPASVLLERILVERRRRWEKAELAKMKAKGKTPKNDKWKAKYKEPVAPDTDGLPKLPEGWCWTTADHLTDATNSITYGVVKLGEVTDGGVPTFRSSNVRQLRLETSYIKPIAPRISEQYRRTILEGGEVLVTVRGTLGGVVVVPDRFRGCNVSREVAVLRLVDRSIGSVVATFIASPVLDRWLKRNTRGNTYVGVNIESLKQLPLPLPPVAEQPRIAEEAERLMSIVEQLATTTKAGVERSSRLRQSILKWAFEGKLVDQDPNDEPASVLLERIRAEREAAAPKKKPRKPRRTKKAPTP